MLQCPKCKKELIRIENNYQCAEHHCFDIAKRGYVNLLLGNHKVSGDDKAMIRARTTFLSHGYYQPLCNRLIEIISKLQPAVFVDAGCGEGFYTNQIADSLNECKVYGFDLSKFGVNEASKAKNDVFYGVANVFHLPVVEHQCDVLLSVFAPHDLIENARVLKENGYFIKVGPGPKHLWDLKHVVYEEVYENEPSEKLTAPFQLQYEELVEYTITINEQQDIWALFQMTPYFWKSPKIGSEKLQQMQTLVTKIQFHIEVYKKV